jgi:hypothetical protein
MYLLYLDESGHPGRNDHAGQTSHYVLFGAAVHVGTWFALNTNLDALKSRYRVDADSTFELHAAPMLSLYAEQGEIANFQSLSYSARRDAVLAWRADRQLNWSSYPSRKLVRKEKKYFRRTAP